MCSQFFINFLFFDQMMTYETYWSEEVVVDFSAGKFQLVSFGRSNNSTTVNVNTDWPFF